MSKALDYPVQAALKLIESDHARALSVTSIAAHVGVSPFHFQRMFFRDLGETVASYIRCRRLEQAAKIIAADRHASLIDVAMDCGFDTHSAFSKAFRQQFAMTPSAFAKGGVDTILFGTSDARPFLKTLGRRTFEFAMDILDSPPLWLQYRTQPGVIDGIFFPDRDAVAADLTALRAHAGNNLMALCGAYKPGPAGFNDVSAMGHYGGLFLEEPDNLWSDQAIRIAAGRWAVFAHYGPYERLYMSWNKACRNWIPANGLSLRDDWVFETYNSSPDERVNRSHSAEIYLPLAKTARMEQHAD